MGDFVRNCSVKMTLSLFQLLSGVMTAMLLSYTIVPTLLRHFRRSLQIKSIITTASRVLKFAEQPEYINQQQRKRLVSSTPPAKLNKLQKLHRNRSNNWPMVSFIHSGSNITTWVRYNFKQNVKHKIQSNFLR